MACNNACPEFRVVYDRAAFSNLISVQCFYARPSGWLRLYLGKIRCLVTWCVLCHSSCDLNSFYKLDDTKSLVAVGQFFVGTVDR